MQGVRPAYQQIQNWTISSGGFFIDEDETAARNVAVVGQTIVTNLFPDGASPLGESIRVRNVPFTVIGVLASKGSGFGGDQDDTIMIPFRTAQIRLFGATSLGSIVIQAARSEDITQITTDVTSVLRERHLLQGTDSDDFTIRSNNDLLTAVAGVTQTMTVLLGGVAAVSLVVGGIGIMNIMLVSVTERTREIHIRMALGARGSDILAQFLIESVVLSSVGGVLGIGIGVLAAYGTTGILGYATTVPLSAARISFGFAALVGVFFGIYPARKASSLDPIEALRHQ